MSRYSRQDVLRILRIHANQLSAWERAGLIPASKSYSFQDMVQLRKLRDLRATRLSAANIRASVDAMQLVSGMANPLLEAGAVRNGSRLTFRVSGAVVDPIARQFVFDFDSPRLGRLGEVGDPASHHAAREARLGSLFLEAAQHEEEGQIDQAATLYETILSVDHEHAAAYINLGTIFYNQRQFTRAEQLYRSATRLAVFMLLKGEGGLLGVLTAWITSALMGESALKS